MSSFPGTGQFGKNPLVRVARVIGGESFERSGERDRRRIQWSVTPKDASSDAQVATATLAWRAVGVQVGDAHPEDPSLRASEFRVSQARENRYAWIVEWTYQPVSPTDPGGDDPTEPGFLEVNVDNEVEFQDFYRQNAAIPVDGTAPLPIAPILDGELIAVDGRPTSLPVRLIRADISIIVEGFPLFATYATASGRRNNVVFLGGAVGSILYTGARSNRIAPNRFRVTHTFVQDEFFHCRQIGTFDPDTNALVDSYWVQPFRDFANFESLLGLPPL